MNKHPARNSMCSSVPGQLLDHGALRPVLPGMKHLMEGMVELARIVAIGMKLF